MKQGMLIRAVIASMELLAANTAAPTSTRATTSD